MWTTFFAAIGVLAVVLFVPGYWLARGLGMERFGAFCFSPVLSVAGYCLVGAAAGLAGVPMSAWLILAIVFGVYGLGYVACLIARRGSLPSSQGEAFHRCLMWGMVGCVAFSSLVTLYAYILPLNGPESFAQIYDNAFHLNLIHAFTESQRYSFLQAATSPAAALAPFDQIVYYPAAWHVVAALGADLMGLSAACAENVANVVFVALVFPLGMYWFLAGLFGDRKCWLAICGLCIPAFVAFPWGFLVAGPLYANMAAFALLPACMGVFMRLVNAETAGAAIRYAILLVLGGVALAASQPNAVFTAMVVLAPYLVCSVYRRSKSSLGTSRARMLATVVAGVLVLLWVVARALPLFSGVVNYPWSPYVSNPFQGIVDYVSLGGRNAIAQTALSFMVIVGSLATISMRKYRWLLFSLIFFGIGYLSAAWTHGGILGSFFSGFWYNDVDRLAASAVFPMIPLAVIGLSVCAQVVGGVLRGALEGRSGRPFAVGMIVLFVVSVYAPTFILPGHGEQPTAFGGRRGQAESLAAERVYLEEQEEAFIQKCKELIGDDACVVANMPYDGSVFAYAEDNLNVLFRHYAPANGEEESVIRQHLDELATNESVQAAVKALDVRYVMLLDSPEGEESTVNHVFFNEDAWSGVSSITDQTPGFKLVLSEGDMKLYEIEMENLRQS